MSRPQDAIPQLSRGDSVEVAQKDGDSASGEALPEGWAWAKVSDLATKVEYGTSAKTSVEHLGVPVLRMGNIVDGVLDFGNMKYLPESCDDFPKLLLNAGDVLFNRTNSAELVGKTAVYNGEPTPCSFASYLIRLCFDKVEPHIIAFYINSSAGRTWASSQVSQQVGQANINGTKLKALEIPLPPRAEQSRIVSAIESLQERSSRARVLLSEVGPLIGQLRQSVLRDAFSGKLTADWRARRSMGPRPVDSSKPNVTNGDTHDPNETHGVEDGTPIHGPGAHATYETASELLLRIRTERRERWQSEQLAKYEAKGKQPQKNWQDKYKEPPQLDEESLESLPELPESWTWATLEELKGLENSSMTDGPFGSKLKTAFYTDSGVRVVRLGNIGVNEFKTKAKAYISLERYEGLRKHEIFAGDVVIAALAEPVGRACLIPDSIGKAIVKADCIRFQPHESVRPEIIVHWLNSATGQRIAEDASHGIGRLRINMENLRSLPVALPPQAEQDALIAKIDGAMESVSEVESGLASMESSLTGLDQSILSKAFRGELVPQDPRDEPASQLLARIREAKEKTTAKKSKRKRKADADG